MPSPFDRSWYDDAKFGIFIHWGLYSVVGWAETIVASDPRHANYVEWYQNTILIENSPAQVRHRALYPSDWKYSDLKPQFEAAAAQCDPSTWAEIFAGAGARYVVPVARHHDGYCLWPTKVPNPYQANWCSERDFLGELKAAVVAQENMRFGLYYSGGFDWTFPIEPELPITELSDVLFPMQTSPDYADYVVAQYDELIDNYSPSILWNDVGSPTLATASHVITYYRFMVPDGVINDRFVMLLSTDADFVTRERTADDTPSGKWELCRGFGMSFGYNEVEADGFDYPTSDELIQQLVDVVGRGGNFLLNVSPDMTGHIAEPQTTRLADIGAWLRINGEAIYNTRPWPTMNESATSEGIRVSLTCTEFAVYAIVQGTPMQSVVTIGGLAIPDHSVVTMLPGTDCPYEVDGSNLRIAVGALPHAAAYAFRITPRPWPN